MISRWGWEERPEYETKMRSFFILCSTDACMSVPIATVCRVIPSFIDLEISFYFLNLKQTPFQHLVN